MSIIVKNYVFNFFFSKQWHNYRKRASHLAHIITVLIHNYVRSKDLQYMTKKMEKKGYRIFSHPPNKLNFILNKIFFERNSFIWDKYNLLEGENVPFLEFIVEKIL